VQISQSVSARISFIQPQIPTLAKASPTGELWVHQPKLDGFRCIVVKNGTMVRLFSRRGVEFRLPGMATALADLATNTAVLDGELVLLGADGRANFFALLREMRQRAPDEAALTFFAFDLLWEREVDLRGLPLSERLRDLARLCRKTRVPCLRLVESFPDGAALLEHCNLLGIEGIVSKRADKPYVSGMSKHWLKLKCEGWRRRNQYRYRVFEKPQSAPATTEREKTLRRRKTELARVQERLADPELRPGLKAAHKAQERLLLQEIAELEGL
jgi:bifunctional non-homologous end joining protein LigD